MRAVRTREPTGCRVGAGAPPARHSEPEGSSPKDRKHRATPGGYGGKPPGVAFIGAPTGARNAGNWCPSGGLEHRYACYTEHTPSASRPDYEVISPSLPTSPPTLRALRRT